MSLLWNAKCLGFWHSTTSFVALLYLSLCFNVSTHIQRTSILIKCIQASSDYWEGKKWKLLHKWSFQAQKFASMGTNWRQIHLTLSFGPKLSLAPCSTPLYFFHTQFWVSSHILAKLGVVIPSFNNFTITLLSSKQNVILLG